MEEDPRRFDRPVKILTGKGFTVSRNVETTLDAAKYLLAPDWPSAGKRALAARKACLAVLEGLKPPSVARKAFEAAAEEAKVRVIGPGLPMGPRRQRGKPGSGKV